MFQRWYHEEGYKIIHKMEDGRKVMNARGEMVGISFTIVSFYHFEVDLPEGEFWLMATELRSTIPLDVYPFWKAFKKCPQGNYWFCWEVMVLVRFACDRESINWFALVSVIWYLFGLLAFWINYILEMPNILFYFKWVWIYNLQT